ncbi:hypothetical protein O181_059991 [Austropuccinia psidii MF-1]|uniref:Reverse transcriptase Ty1/copia-type domain-containing protein n=1 Tax=Austropuccinia psidii MF-1 TaxID=1389203 RepID=A0A9Q3ED93_9BASI|nr:hypothetical protein [Austropuccinia psidii MF-1]
MWFYNQETKKIRISRDFQLPQMQGEVQTCQDLDNLPTAVMEHENHEVPINTHEAVPHSQTKEAAIQIEGNQLELTVKSKRQPTQHLGYMITWHKDGSLGLSQSDLIRKILYDNDMSDSKGGKTPCNGKFYTEIDDEGEIIAITAYQRAIGSLNYLAQHTQPDIMFTINQLLRYSIKPTIKHWTAIKHPMRYLKATINLSLNFSKCTNKTLLEGWADADYANDRTDRKSITGIRTSGYRNLISWLSKKPTVVAQSTTEAEFIAMNICAKKLRWMSFLLMKMGIEDSKPTLYNNTSGAMTISKQATLNPNTKNIEIRFQYLRDIVLKRQLTIVEVGTDNMLADVLTKPLGL